MVYTNSLKSISDAHKAKFTGQHFVTFFAGFNLHGHALNYIVQTFKDGKFVSSVHNAIVYGDHCEPGCFSPYGDHKRITA